MWLSREPAVGSSAEDWGLENFNHKAGLLGPRINWAHAAKNLYSRTMFADRLLGRRPCASEDGLADDGDPNYVLSVVRKQKVRRGQHPKCPLANKGDVDEDPDDRQQC
jgi:hypothetical protein